jgi:hypothetical protein
MQMTTKEAVQVAKSWVIDTFSDEEIRNVGLEEVKLVEGNWNITIGFTRPWDKYKSNPFIVTTGLSLVDREYEVLVVDDASKNVIEMRNRDDTQ